jgi:hypothetical protein
VRFRLCFGIGRAICCRDDPQFVRELYGGLSQRSILRRCRTRYPWTSTHASVAVRSQA